MTATDGYRDPNGEPNPSFTPSATGHPDREPTSAEKLLGSSLVDAVNAFGGLGMLVMQTIADGGSLDDVLEATADFMDGRDCVDDESIALFNRAKATLATRAGAS